jgi:hypothetical protein
MKDSRELIKGMFPEQGEAQQSLTLAGALTRFTPRQGRDNAERFARIQIIIAYVENVKNIHLSDEEAVALANELERLPESTEHIELRAGHVIRANTYGKLAFEYWLNAEPVYSRSEAMAMADREIARRKAVFEAGNKNVTPEALAKQGLVEVQGIWNSMLNAEIEKYKDQINEKCKALKSQYYRLDAVAKKRLWSIALDEKIVEADSEHWEMILPMLVPKMMTHFEEAVSLLKYEDNDE